MSINICLHKNGEKKEYIWANDIGLTSSPLRHGVPAYADNIRMPTVNHAMRRWLNLRRRLPSAQRFLRRLLTWADGRVVGVPELRAYANGRRRCRL
jgi:2-hydroxychromene-2-carboxylate isomerase